MACINIKHPEYINLVNRLSEFGITNPVDIQGKIHEYQEETNTDLFPGLDYFNIEDEVVNDVLEKRQNKIQANQQQLSVIQPSNVVKEGVGFVFEQNPELANIGSQEQYSQYLDTIFPDSEVKDIYLHQTNIDFKDIGFDKNKIGSNTNNNGYYGYGFYFVKDAGTPIDGGWGGFASAPIAYGEIEMPVILNIKKIKNGITTIQKDPKKLTAKLKKEGYDSINAPDGLVVFEPEQIHILGSKQDIEGFRKYVDNAQINQPDITTNFEQDINDLDKWNAVFTHSFNFESGRDKTWVPIDKNGNIIPHLYGYVIPKIPLDDLNFKSYAFVNILEGTHNVYYNPTKYKVVRTTDDFISSGYAQLVKPGRAIPLTKEMIFTVLKTNVGEWHYQQSYSGDLLIPIDAEVVDFKEVLRNEYTPLIDITFEKREYINYGDMLQNFEQYFPDYSYLNEEERIVFIKGIESGDITITCTK